MRTAAALARTIAEGFRAYRDGFGAITIAAKHRFEASNWLGVQSANTERLVLYNRHMLDLIRRLGTATRGTALTAADWRAIKAAYTDEICTNQDYELAETFYNSVYRAMQPNAPVHSDGMFMRSSFAVPPVRPREPIYVEHQHAGDLAELFRKLLAQPAFKLDWVDQDADIANLCQALRQMHPELPTDDQLSVQLLRSVFYRNKGAYLVGRLCYGGGRIVRHLPLVIPVLQNATRELFVDALITDTDQMSVMFSFTRAYFMVDLPCPYAMVNFLTELLPQKQRSELYAAIGLHKHGKTSFYRAFLNHLDNSTDDFIIAPGIKGMVMAVFMLPSYQTVFKVIKDEFPSQKSTTPQKIKHTYQVVKTHDRVGRMADTQEFENITFPRARFSADLLQELLDVAASSVTLTDDEVIIRHLYTERQMIPLNLYVETATDEQLSEALDEYGNAIKQLAAANIFPGDMLLKNFGVTRHGRVVFYDYDEICYLTDVNFRAVPQPRTPEEEMSSEVWYSVAANDVFPEEFRHFLFGKPGIKARFAAMHGELFDPTYWQSLQQQLLAGEVAEVYPYRQRVRFSHTD